MSGNTLPCSRSSFNPEKEAEQAELVFKAKSQHCPNRSDHITPVGFYFWKKSVKVVREPFLKCKPPKGTRKKISSFSNKAKRKLRFTALNATQGLTCQFCLTYHNFYPSDGVQVKSHMNRFLNKFRRKFQGYSYLWILEFQSRGVPHFHFFSSLPVTDPNRMILAAMWADIVDPGNEALRKFHEHPKNFIQWDMGNGQYLCKYLDKEAQKHVPEKFDNVGRFWGASRGLVGLPQEVRSHYVQKHLSSKVDQPVKVITRWLGKWHENKVKQATKGKFSSNVRTTPYGYTIADGGKGIFLQIIEYLAGLPNLKGPAVPF